MHLRVQSKKRCISSAADSCTLRRRQLKVGGTGSQRRYVELDLRFEPITARNRHRWLGLACPVLRKLLRINVGGKPHLILAHRRTPRLFAENLGGISSVGSGHAKRGGAGTIGSVSGKRLKGHLNVGCRLAVQRDHARNRRNITALATAASENRNSASDQHKPQHHVVLL